MKRPSQKFLWGSLFFILSSIQIGHAVPAFKKEFANGARTCFTDPTAAKANVARAMQKFPRAAGPPSNLNPRVIVLRVDFTDRNMSASKAQSETFFNRVSQFFVENSYGVFVPTFTVSSVVHRIGALGTYGADCGSDIACRDDDLLEDAVAAEQLQGTDFSTFDQLMVYHAGDGQETSGVGNDIWSVYLSDEFQVDGQTFSGFTVVPESEALNVDPLGVVCHEYGHQLGLPDLYDVSSFGGQTTVGRWDLMDFPYTAASGQQLGSNPPHLGAWSKKFLGFNAPSDQTSSLSGSLAAASVSPQAYELQLFVSDQGPDNEYFLVEYRNITSTAAYDKGIPGSGVLIWHIDDSIALDADQLSRNQINSPELSGRSHRGVELVEADFTDVSANSQRGEASDAFTEGSSFLSPQSDAYNGVASGIVLTSIDLTNTVATFSVEMPPVSTFTVTAGVPLSTQIVSGQAVVSIDVPAGSFAAGTPIYASGVSENTFAQLPENSQVARLTRTGVGCLLGAGFHRQPAAPVQLSIDFSNVASLTALSEAEKKKLVIARYSPDVRRWVPLSSAVDSNTNRITSPLNHLSLFQIMASEAVTSVSDVKVFPNPLLPSRGLSYSTMNFSNVPANTVIRIYSLRGESIRDITADSSGLATWNGRNSSEREVASGVYLAIVEDPDGGEKHISKIAIQR